MEAMPIDTTVLQRTARVITFIPEHYELVMEDNTPKGFDEKARTFIWKDPQLEDHEIEVSLSLKTGQLLRLAIDQEPDASQEVVSTIDQAKVVSKAFMSKHHPDHKALTSIRAELKSNDYIVKFSAEVGGLPLPDTGCEFRLDRNLNIVRYQAEEYTEQDLPDWPAEVVTPEAAKQRIIQDIHMGLIITTLYPSMYEMEGSHDQHRLVYEPVQGRRKIDAATGEPLYPLQHDLLPPTVSITPAYVEKEGQETSNGAGGQRLVPMAPSCPATKEEASDGYASVIRFWEEQLGIDTTRYVMDRPRGDEENLVLFYFEKSDMDEETKDDQENRAASDPLSVDGYMERRWGDALRHLEASYRIHIDKSTGCLERLHYRPSSPEGEVVFTREQCWRIAEGLLQRFFPEYATYLQLEVNEDEEDGGEGRELQEDHAPAEPRNREFFYLPLYVDQYRVRLERAQMVVSTITGEVLHYRGVSKERIIELKACHLEPVVSPEEALARYVDHLDVSLKWVVCGDDNTSNHKLIYAPVYKGREEKEDTAGEYVLEFIDAVNGEPIWLKR